jgi:hypothetical protein
MSTTGWRLEAGDWRLGAAAPLLALLLCAAAVMAGDARRVEVGNLAYAGDKTSVCFSDRFLTTVKAEAGIDAATRMRGVRLADAADLASVPFAVMNGQEAFRLTADERANLKLWLSTGGFLLASAGCSSQQWNASFATEMEAVFGAGCLAEVGLDHAIFKTLFTVPAAPLSHGGTASFKGLTLDGRLVCLFSPEGLNDTAHTQGCCCCGGNEVKAAEEIVANVLIYALVE